MSEPGGLFAGIFARGGSARDGGAHSGGALGDQAWLAAMLDTEAALARALERAGLAEPGAGAAVTAAARPASFDPAELGERAALTGNPVPALVRALSGLLPPSAAAAVHRGATSQDIIDTAMMLLARDSAAVTLADLSGAAAAAAELAEAHAATPMIGRTLLQQAVPITFGLVAAGWLTGLDEASTRLAELARGRLAVQFGGAAGTLATLGQDGPRVAALLAEELGLASPVTPWHTNRLRIIELAAALAGVCAATGKIARDVTLLAQTEVGEVREGRGSEVREAAGGELREAGAGPVREAGGEAGGLARGGSSAMPHKRNPVAAIAILGCAKQAPGLLATLAAAAEQEHQRAAGGWHAEWLPLAQLLTLTGSAASWCAQLLAGLEVNAAAMGANLDATGGLALAEHVTALLAGRLGRLAAHDLVAGAAARAMDTGRPFREVLLDAADGVTAAEVDAALAPDGYLAAAEGWVTRALAAHRPPPAPVTAQPS